MLRQTAQVLPDHQFLTVAFQLVTMGSFGPTIPFSGDLRGREVVMLMAQKMPQKNRCRLYGDLGTIAAQFKASHAQWPVAL